MIREQSLVDDLLDILPAARRVLEMNGVELDDEDLSSTLEELADRYGLSAELLVARLQDAAEEDEDDDDAWSGEWKDAPIYEPSRTHRNREERER